MHINPKNVGPARPEISRTAPVPETADRGPIAPVSPVPSSADRSDKVQISDAGRALAARGGDAATSGLDALRASPSRGRILSGAYDTLEVVDAVSRRLLASGDL